MRAVVLVLEMLCCSAFGSFAYGDVTMQFVEPQRYTDGGRYGDDAKRTLMIIEGHLLALGKRCVAADQSLAIRVRDVDLAGRPEWWRVSAYGLRIMHGITWPRMDLQYKLKGADGAVLAQGRDRVADMEYLSRSAYLRGDSDPLVYDRAMLTDWFERRFCRSTG